MTLGTPCVVDTNVVVAGLITRDTSSPVARILDGMVTGAFRFALSVDLLAEYRDVLLRPRIARVHHLDESTIDVVLESIVRNAVMIESTQAVEAAPDRKDDHLWRLLASIPRACLVTGDRQLQEQPPPFAAVISPREWIDSQPPQ